MKSRTLALWVNMRKRARLQRNKVSLSPLFAHPTANNITMLYVCTHQITFLTWCKRENGPKACVTGVKGPAPFELIPCCRSVVTPKDRKRWNNLVNRKWNDNTRRRNKTWQITTRVEKNRKNNGNAKIEKMIKKEEEEINRSLCNEITTDLVIRSLVKRESINGPFMALSHSLWDSYLVESKSSWLNKTLARLSTQLWQCFKELWDHP